MIKCEFAEKLYEILIIHEFLNKYKGSNVYCPSQYKESKLGYDALFNLKGTRKIIILQFKISQMYIKSPVYFSSSSNCFKFELHKKNNYYQHNKLVKYNKSKKYLALYCSPRFTSNNDLYKYCCSSQIIQNSFLGKPIYKISDDKYHYVNYNDIEAYQHSDKFNELEQINLNTIDKVICELPEISQQEFCEIINDCNEQSIFLLI